MLRPLRCLLPLLYLVLLAGQTTCNRHLTSLVPPTPLVLLYHNGPLLTGDSQSPLLVHLLWYGSFSPSQRSIVTDFFSSFSEPSTRTHVAPGQRMNKQHVLPSVQSWWKLVASYVDKSNASVANVVKLGKQSSDIYSIGKNLKRVHMQALLLKAIKNKSLPSPLQKAKGLCAWPFATPQFGPPNPPLLPPNQDVGIDGMIINIATLLAGAATNPFGTGYFQGDASAPLEAASACAGSFGPGAYPGYPGKLQMDIKSKGSFNAIGSHERKYLLPSLWNPLTFTCTTPQ